MSWVAVGGAAVGVIGGALTQDKNGGAGAQSSNREPWANAQPLLVQSLNQAYGLGQQYQNQPFSPAQTAAYGNAAHLSDYGRQIVPSLLAQLGQQPLGYDKNNPGRRPQAFDWQSALLANPRQVENVQAAPVAPPAPVVAAAAPAAAPQFMQQGGDFLTHALARASGQSEAAAQGQQGRYGSYGYGDPMTAQNMGDARMYMLLGGRDPNQELSIFGGR
jgi:hypothetical protein